jgi:putative transposase
MREIDFSEGNLWNRWSGVKGIWDQIQGETKGFIKGQLERAMCLDVHGRVGCGRYERSFGRRGYRNGIYSRDLLTTYGWIGSLSVPRIREGGYEPMVFERYRRRQRQVDRVILEAFLLGHSTRKTGRLFRGLFGESVSAQAVSNIVHELDEEVAAFHRRALRDDYRFLYLDGVWVTLSKPVKVRKVLLMALGVKDDGTKELLSFQLSSSESESCWWGVLSDLKDRGLKGRDLEVIVSDAAHGLVKAIQAIYPRIKHQHCTFHHCQNLATHLQKKGHQHRIIADALFIFEAATETESRGRLHIFADKWLTQEPKAVRNFIKSFEYCLTYLEYPEPWRTLLKTNNPIERYLEEIRRRIIPMRSFNNARSVNRIIYGIIAYVLNHNSDMPYEQFTQAS